MIFLGIILAVSAASVGVAVVLSNTDRAALSAFGDTVPGITSEWHVFMAGAVVAIVFTVGMMMATLGLGRSIRRRNELRYMREEHEESMHTLELEKLRLQRELARVRKETTIQPGPTVSRQAHSN